MTTLLDELSNIISALEDGGIEYAVCGGLALTVYGFVRASYGIDVLIRAEPLEKACEAAAKNGFNTRRFDKSPKEGAVEIHRVSKTDDDSGTLPLKFLLVNPKIEDVWKTREKLIWQDKTLWIVSREGLIKIKKLAGRAKDLIDVDRIENEEN